MGLNTNDTKSKKEVRRRLTKELKEDGFGDDIFDFLDQLDHVMEAPDMNKIKKELSPSEFESLEKSAKQMQKKYTKGDLAKSKKVKEKEIEKGEEEEEEEDDEDEEELEGMSEDDGLDEDLSDEIVDANYLRSYAKNKGIRVMNEDGEEEKEDSEKSENVSDADLLESSEEEETGEDEDEEEEAEEEDEEEEEEDEEEEKDDNEEDEDNSDNTSEKEEGQPSSKEDEKDNKGTKAADSNDQKDIRYEDITDIYGRVKAGHEEDLKRFTAKYVPPHLRNQSATSDEATQFDQAIAKQIREIINKVTDDTFVSMCHLLVATYAKYPKNSVRSSLYTTVIAATKNQFKIIHHYIRLYAGLIAAAQHESDMNVVSYITENVVNLFEAECQNAIAEHDTNVGKRIR